jgi:hypothetical protein
VLIGHIQDIRSLYQERFADYVGFYDGEGLNNFTLPHSVGPDLADQELLPPIINVQPGAESEGTPKSRIRSVESYLAGWKKYGHRDVAGALTEGML